jgi:hypothetical protein
MKETSQQSLAMCGVVPSEIIGETVVYLQGENVGKEKLEAIGSGAGQ